MVGAPLDYAPTEEHDYRRTPPICVGLQAVFWTMVAGLAIYGAYALLFL